MWRASREGWLLIALGAIISVATTAFLVIRPVPLPSGLPGRPALKAGILAAGASDGQAAGPSPGPVFSVSPGDREITVTWRSTGAIELYRAAAVAEAGDPSAVPCRSTASPSAVLMRCVASGLRNGVSYLVSVFSAQNRDSVPVRTFRAVPRPAVLTSASVVAWFDAGDYATIRPNPQEPAAIGSRVLAIRDKSPHHHDANQEETERQPTIGQLGRLPALALDGNDVLTVAESGFPAADSPSTVLAVAAQDDPAPDTTCFRNLLSWGSDKVGRARIIHKGCGTPLAFAETYGTWVDQAPTLTWPTGRPTVVSAVFEAGRSTLRLDGALSYRWSGPRTQRMNTATGGVVSLGGAAWDAPGSWRGRIGEIVVFDRVLTATELRAVEDYLGARWQVPMGSAGS
jgi:hypothetical protein